VKAWIDEHTAETMIPFSAEFEQEYQAITDADEKKAFLTANKTKSMMEKITVNGFSCLNLMYFFTCGFDEVKCWTIQKGMKAPQAGGRIHGDFEKGFQSADVMNFVDWKEQGGEVACKASGKLRQQGRDYEVKDGDIIHFKVNTAGIGKKK